ncbi:MAG: ComEA family DNA-binding protein [Oscillospiraceae bacterium]|jgi:comEA protein|nr:ComEA family DNA-binding protein [Oscillospiraceae bacterium]
MKKRVFGAGTAGISKALRRRKPELLLAAAALVIFALIWGADALRSDPVEIYVPAGTSTKENASPTAAEQDSLHTVLPLEPSGTDALPLSTGSTPQSAAQSKQSTTPAPTAKPQSAKVNINTANVQELQALPYIGQVKAQAIADYRAQHGAFLTAEDLLNVKGIGTATLERIRAYLVF